MEALPLVVLGIHSVLKTDIHCSIAELVYGTTLSLPGKMFASDLSLLPMEPTNYITQLKVTMSKLKAPPVHK